MARIFNAVRAENTPSRRARGDFKQALTQTAHPTPGSSPQRLSPHPSQRHAGPAVPGRGSLRQRGGQDVSLAAYPRAIRHASPSTCWEVTPSLENASFFTINIACSNSFGSGESTTITRREVPFTKGHRSFLSTGCVFPVFPGLGWFIRCALKFPRRHPTLLPSASGRGMIG